jgi:hypothetical protein
MGIRLPHAVALPLAVRTLEGNARAINDLSRVVHDDRAMALRLDMLADSVLNLALRLEETEFFNMVIRRSLLRSAVLLVQAACRIRSEAPDSVPALEPFWRSVLGALPEIFRI